jgi:hypothetical protein
MEVGSLSLRLRRMLVDGKPLVNIVNRKHRKNIHFPLAPSVEHRLSKTVVLYVLPKDMLSTSTNLFVKMDDFLSHKILEIEGKSFSIKRVIKLVANNLGGVHFDYEAAIKDAQFNFKNRSIIQALRLAIYHIAKATSAALRELSSLCSPFPNYTQFLGHYSAEDDGLSTIKFESQDYLEVNYPENTVTSAISILSVLEILPQKYKKTCLISFKLRDTSTFDISLSSDGDVGACFSKEKNNLELCLCDNREIRPIGKKIYIRASLEKRALNTCLEIEVQGRVKAVNFEYPINKLDLMRCVIGARNNGDLGAGFLLNELCILSTNDPSTQKNIIKYFQLRYLS